MHHFTFNFKQSNDGKNTGSSAMVFSEQQKFGRLLINLLRQKWDLDSGRHTKLLQQDPHQNEKCKILISIPESFTQLTYTRANIENKRRFFQEIGPSYPCYQWENTLNNDKVEENLTARVFETMLQKCVLLVMRQTRRPSHQKEDFFIFERDRNSSEGIY